VAKPPRALLAALRGEAAAWLAHRLSPRRALRALAPPWLRGYSRAKFARDAVAALVVLTLIIPQCMSYAVLTGVPTVYGLYSSILPLVVVGLVTGSTTQQPGIVAPMAITAISIGRQLAPPGVLEGSAAFARIQVQLAFASGAVALAMWALNLAWVTELLSQPVITGFSYGSAGLIIASQVADLLGIAYKPSEIYFGPRLARAGQNVLKANPVSAAIGLGSLLVLLYAKDVRVRGYQLPKLTPVPLFVLIAMVAASYALDLSGAHGVKIVGNIPSQLPGFAFPFDGAAPLGDFLAMLPSAVLAATVSFVQLFSIASTFGRRRNETISASRELFGIGLANVLGGLNQCVVCSASFSRTGVAVDAGVASPACTIMVGCLMAVAVVTLTPVLRFLPAPTLAAVVVASMKSILLPAEALALWRGKLSDFLQMLMTVVCVLVLDAQNGLFAGIGFSLALVLWRTLRPRIAELGRLPGTDVFVAHDRYPGQAAATPGVLVLRLEGDVSFVNVRRLSQRLELALKLHAAAAAEAAAEAAAAGAAGAGAGAGAAAGAGAGAAGPSQRGRGLPAHAAAAAAAVAGPNDAAGASCGADDAAGVAPCKRRTVWALADADADADDAAYDEASPLTSPRAGANAGAAFSVGAGAAEGSEAAQPLVARAGARGVVRAGGLGGQRSILGAEPDPSAAPTSASASAFASASASAASADAAAARASAFDRGLLRAVVLDCSRVIDVDATSCREVAALLDAFARANVPLLLAALPGPVRDTLQRFGVGDDDSAAAAAAATAAANAAAAAAAAAAPGGTASAASAGSSAHSAAAAGASMP